MRRLSYIMDQHVMSATDVAQTLVWKAWTPQTDISKAVQLGYSGVPSQQQQVRERWIVYQMQMAVAAVTTGYHRQGHAVRMHTWGPPGYGGLYVQPHQQMGISVWTGYLPTDFGVGWSLYVYNGGRIQAGDVVQFNCVYEVVRWNAP